MDRGLFFRALFVQALSVGLVFATLLALPLEDDFFESYGFVVGPLAWAGCSLMTARILELPLGLAIFAALAGGVAGTLVLLAASHIAGIGVALLVFAASCAGYDAERDAAPAS